MAKHLPVTGAIFLLVALSSCASPQASPTPTSTRATLTSPTSPHATSTTSPLPKPIFLSGTGGNPALLPPPRGYHQMAYDVESDRAILFSGEASPESGFLGATWAYDLAINSWQQMAPAQSPESAAAADCLAYDFESDRVILFVGSYFYGLGHDPEQTAAGETWAYDFNSDSWTKMHPATSPFGVVGARMAYDAESDRIILFGGAEAGTFTPTDATWAYDFNSDTWTEMGPEERPQAEYFHAMTYSPRDDRVILLKAYPNQLWAYDYDVDTWQQLQPPTMPPARYYSSLVYDEVSDRVLLFGGESAASEKPLADLWSFDSLANQWTELAPENPPGARGWHAAAYGAVARLMLLFGGGPSRESFTDETWLYDPKRNSWTEVVLPP